MSTILEVDRKGWESLEQGVINYLRGLEVSYRRDVLGIPVGQLKKIRLPPIYRGKPTKGFFEQRTE